MGVLVQMHGPHLFHTSNERVFNYLSRFTEWVEYEHEVLGHIDGQNVPLPFNLNTLHQLFAPERATHLEQRLSERYGENMRVPILELRRTDDPDLRELAEFVYNKVFKNYTAKQWGLPVEKLDPQVTARVPVVLSRDNRYFSDRFQALPKYGYTQLFERLLDHPAITVVAGCDYQERLTVNYRTGRITFDGVPYGGALFFTGMIDEFFDYRFGALPYRSLRMEFETLRMDHFQEKAVVNYPNDHDFTRITEFKHFNFSKNEYTTLLREYPQPYDHTAPGQNIPYYPLFVGEAQALYQRYAALADGLPGGHFVGRLAEFRYYDMDDAVENALARFERLCRRL